MLAATAVGMAAYGLYAAGWALLDLRGLFRLEIWTVLRKPPKDAGFRS